MKIYSKLTCADKIVPKAEAIMLENWCKKDSYKSLKIFSSTWLMTYNFDLEKTKQSKSLY